MLCSHHHYSSSELKKKSSETLDSLNNNPSFLQLLAATLLLSISLNMTTLGISYNWNHTVFVLCFLILPWSLRSIHIVTCVRIPSPFKRNWSIMLYNVVSVSDVQQRECAVSTYIYVYLLLLSLPPTLPSPLCRLPKS